MGHISAIIQLFILLTIYSNIMLSILRNRLILTIWTQNYILNSVINLEGAFLVSSCTIPTGYKPKLNLYETQKAITIIKRSFESNMEDALNLKRVSAPLFVNPVTGLNDDLNGIERPVQFDIPDANINAQVVHSLAKWKRMVLGDYGFRLGQGLYTNMNAIRRDEVLDNLHSIYVDQWDWEKIISEEERNIETLKQTVQRIVNCILASLATLKARFPSIDTNLNRDIHFITTQELEDEYPNLTPEQRENEAARKYKTLFIMKIGGKLKSGIKHGGRAPDYDDWTLNGDIVFYNEVLQTSFEVSSMGIRVDADALDKQLKLAGWEEKRNLKFHKMVLNNQLPLTIGGGVGQSRLCMLLIGNAHIGEVQSSIWDEQTIDTCKKSGVIIL